WATATIIQRLQAFILVATKDLVPGLARDAELPANLAHSFSLEKTGYEAKTLLHHRTLLPRHQRLPLQSGKCYPCVRYKSSPMSRAVQVTTPEHNDGACGCLARAVHPRCRLSLPRNLAGNDSAAPPV